MLKITAVRKKSAAYKAGIRVGDEVTGINGYPAVDEFDLLYFDGEEICAEIDGKGSVTFFADDIEVESTQKMRLCHNNCLFCFVDQMPEGMRESLYVKDDDYTMSFECGNFVTLTNVSDEEIDRIIRLHLSPLYVSVHAINPEVRCKLMRNRFAGKIVEQIKRLCEAGIELHCQAVIVPGLNDGEELKRTARELFAYYPTVCDLAVVPTGLTKFRDGLTPIPDVDGAYSEQFLQIVDELNGEFGVNFVLPADEYFIKAGKPFKDVEFYGDFSQIENGIGMTSKLLAEFEGAVRPARRKAPTRTVCICGTSAYSVIQACCERANGVVENLQARALAVKNEFFGETVTCTGLLTGQDIYAALEREKGSYDEVILASDTLKSFEEVFLCGMTLTQLKGKLHFENIRVNADGGEGLFELLSHEE